MSGQKKRPLEFSISGFPEYLPQYRRVEMRWLKSIAETFESYGYANIETPSVEAIETLMAKGEDVDKEIYALTRLAADSASSEEAKLALHYDLTVPFARYVADHFSELTFPFKRYQMQRVWRGERPQEGRYREFTQCDIDVVDQNSVSLAYDAEMLEVVMTALARIEVGPVLFQVSNRKLMQGVSEWLGAKDAQVLARLIDKLGKMPREVMIERLRAECGLSDGNAEKCLAFADIKGSFAEVRARVAELGVTGAAAFDEGMAELDAVLSRVESIASGSVRVEADLSISRGFDYYTGSIYEARFVDFPGYSSICAGGRYDNLVGSFIRRNLPGVGISIGLTRIFTKLLKEGRIEGERACPTQILMANLDAAAGPATASKAQVLRARGFSVELYPEPARLDKQLKYADRKGIPYVWLSFAEGDQVKPMFGGEQRAADAASFVPETPAVP